MIKEFEDIRQGLAVAMSAYKTVDLAAYESLVPAEGSGAKAADIARRVDEALGQTLPASFIEALTRWDLGRARLGNIVFSLQGDYAAYLVSCNEFRAGLSWWDDRGTEERPLDRLMIAQGDPYVVLLDAASGAIETYAASDGSFTNVPVAPDLDRFLRALGTIEVTPPEGLNPVDDVVNALLAELGSGFDRSFWTVMVRGRADP